MNNFKLRDLAMICLGALLVFLFFEFVESSPLNELREEYSKVLTFSKKHGYSSGLPCALDDLSCD